MRTSTSSARTQLLVSKWSGTKGKYAFRIVIRTILDNLILFIRQLNKDHSSHYEATGGAFNRVNLCAARTATVGTKYEGNVY